MRNILFLYLTISLIAAFPVFAQQVVQIPVHSGTGFFVNQEDIVTNEHVIGVGCSQIILQRNGIDWTTAQVIAADKDHDLALLHSVKRPKQPAPFRRNFSTLKAGDAVEAMGYPADALKAGHYEFTTAKMIDTHESLGNTHMIQYSDSTRPGYSGGPLMDASGNVVGVVKGGIRQFTTEVINGQAQARQQVGQLNEAVSLPALEAFLNVYGITYLAYDSAAPADTADIEKSAQDFVVNVQCLERQASATR